MIQLTKEEAQQVLGALEPIALYKAYNGDDWPARQVMPAIETLRAALAQGEQEPVAWLYKTNNAWEQISFVEPPDDAYDEGSLRPLCFASQQREWQGLTDEEIFAVAKAEGQKLALKKNPTIDLDFARAISDKLKEKNT